MAKDFGKTDTGTNGKGKGPTGTPVDPDSPWRHNESTGKRERQGRLLPFESRIRELLVGFSGVSVIAGDAFTAAALDAYREELAYGYAKLAKEDARVAHVLKLLFEGSAWTEALIPTVGLLAVVGWHYGFVPPKLGVPLTVAKGLTPMSREQEVEIRRRKAAEQAGPQKPEGEGGGQHGSAS